MESDGKRHACKSDDRHQPEPDETSVSEIRCSECGELEANGHYSFCSRSQTPKPVSPTPSKPDVNNVAASLVELLASSVKPEDIAAMVDARLDNRLDMATFKSDMVDTVSSIISEAKRELMKPTELRVTRTDETVVTIEKAHNMLPKLIKAVSAGLQVLMVGPMGTGKSTLAANVAEALGRDFAMMSVGPQTSEAKILGYITADGNYVPSLFRKIYEHGGIWLFDELDAAHPGVMTIINAALSNGHAAFPDGMVTRHPDTVIIAAANTYGRGPDRMYVGRQALDAATLDRFAVMEIGVDEPLEASLAYATGLDISAADRVIRYVRALRKSAENQKMALGFSPRATVAACTLLAQGFSTDEAIAMSIRKGISDQDWSKVSSSVNPLF